ncbi:MAG TPA: radical SAM protein [Candidatus Methylomirabilis sp.]|nr:radical SAM protein [Candidatus Methylomirabilis sp.]
MSQAAKDSDNYRVFILDASKRCEPSAFLFTRAVNFFLLNGYRISGDIDTSAVILVNSCCVTEDKIAASMAALEAARVHAGRKRIVLFGCLASLPLPQLEREDLICIGPKNLDDLDSYFPHHTSIREVRSNQLPPALYEPGQGLRREEYFVLIAQGCSNQCSYCNIKRSKGAVRSEPLATIESQIRRGLSVGVDEFTLIADDCASYGQDVGVDLVQLLDHLLALEGSFRLKLGYVFPAFLLKRFDGLRSVFATDRISYANIPVQSGSQRILDLMNRRYAIDRVADCVHGLHQAAPHTTLCTHLLVNFPTETHEDFLKTLHVADGFDEALFLHYSDNQGTAASELQPKVPPQEVRRRLDIASEYINQTKRGRGAVIEDFNCAAPYNVLRTPGG